MTKLIYEASRSPHTYWYISPSYTLAKRTVWDDPDIMPRLLPGWIQGVSGFFNKNETSLRIRFPKSGGSIYLIGADRPDLMRGPNPQGVIHDEFSVQRKEVWQDVIQPILLANPSSWAWFLFTPRGKNHAFDLIQEHKDHPDWQYSEVNVYNSGIFTKDQADLIRSQMRQDSFNQEFMCQFLEGEGSVFRHVRDVLYQPIGNDLNVLAGHVYVMGVDLAKHQDYTVIVVYDRQTNKQVYQDRFHQLEWPFIRAKIRAASQRFNRALTVIDATGVGDPIVDDLQRSGVPIKAVSFTNQTKKELIEKLSIAIEQHYIRILPEEQTLLEFDNFEYNYTKSGLVSYGARVGVNDDVVIAHALAVSELTPVVKPATVEEDLTPIARYFRALKDPNHGDNIQLLNEWSTDSGYEE